MMMSVVTGSTGVVLEEGASELLGASELEEGAAELEEGAGELDGAELGAALLGAALLGAALLGASDLGATDETTELTAGPSEEGTTEDGFLSQAARAVNAATARSNVTFFMFHTS
jgi:hypothetical protein